MQHRKLIALATFAALAFVAIAPDALAQMPTTLDTSKDPFETGGTFMEWLFLGLSGLLISGAGIAGLIIIGGYIANKPAPGWMARVLIGLIAASGLTFIISKAVGA